MGLHEPLKLLDIRKEQRRITALLGHQKDVPRLKIRRRANLPDSYCYVCSRLAPGIKFRSPNGALFDKGFFGKCEHLMRTPYPTAIGPDGFGMARPISESSVNDVKDMLKRTKEKEKATERPNEAFGGRAFISKTPIEKERSKDRFSVVSETNTSVTAREDTQISEVKPFLTIENIQPRRGAEEQIIASQSEEAEETDEFHLPHIGPGRVNIVNKSSREVNEMAKLEVNKHVKGKPNGSRLLRFADESVIGEEQSLAATEDSGHLSYHHRTSRENVPVAGFDEVCKPRSENSFELVRPQSRSMISRDDTAIMSEGSFIFERISSGEWCECFDVDLNKLLCSECDFVGSHDKSCSLARSNSRLGLCPNCGKPVRRNRRSFRDSRETSMTERERKRTCSRESMGRRSRSLIRPSGRADMFHQDRMRIRSTTDEDYMDVENIIYDDDGSISGDEEFDEELEMRRRNAKPWPTYHPDIHKEAYCGALGEARSKRVRKIHVDTIEDTLMQQTVTKPFVFSYYRLLPFRRKKDTAFPSLTARRNQEDEIKIKNGMKHIFGDVKVDDFYNKTRNSKMVARKPKNRSTDIRTQVEITRHTPI